MVRIRLKRMGRKKAPFYRLVAVDSRARRDGKELDLLGHYNPMEKGKGRVEVFREKVLYWLDKGAIPSETVTDILRRENIQKDPKR